MVQVVPILRTGLHRCLPANTTYAASQRDSGGTAVGKLARIPGSPLRPNESRRHTTESRGYVHNIQRDRHCAWEGADEKSDHSSRKNLHELAQCATSAGEPVCRSFFRIVSQAPTCSVLRLHMCAAPGQASSMFFALALFFFMVTPEA